MRLFTWFNFAIAMLFGFDAYFSKEFIPFACLWWCLVGSMVYRDLDEIGDARLKAETGTEHE